MDISDKRSTKESLEELQKLQRRGKLSNTQLIERGITLKWSLVKKSSSEGVLTKSEESYLRIDAKTKTKESKYTTRGIAKKPE